MISLTDNAILLSVRKHGETSALIDMLTEQHGLYKGAVRGAFSKNNRGLYQPGNVISATWSARLSEQMGSIRGEMHMPYAALIMHDAHATAMLTSATALLSVALPERHAYPRLYTAMQHLLAHLAHAPQDALEEYIQFELLLLAETGFGLDLSCCAATGTTENLIYVSPKSGRAVSAEAGEPYKDKLLPFPASLATTGYFLEHWLFESLHKKIPAARKRLQLAR
jgi:DNA repair protein RecO (recombination protein O)